MNCSSPNMRINMHVCGTGTMCSLLLVAGLMELLVACTKVDRLWLTHVIVHLVGGTMCILASIYHMRVGTLFLQHRSRGNVLSLRWFLCLAVAVQMLGLLLLLCDKYQLVALAMHKTGIKSDATKAWLHVGDTQVHSDVRDLILGNLVSTLFASVLTAYVFQFPLSDRCSNVATISGHWVYNDSRPVAESTASFSPQADVSILRGVACDVEENVQLHAYRPLAMEHRITAPARTQFAPKSIVSKLSVDQTDCTFSVGRTAHEPMRSFKPLPSEDQGARRLTSRLLSTALCSAHPLPGAPVVVATAVASREAATAERAELCVGYQPGRSSNQREEEDRHATFATIVTMGRPPVLPSPIVSSVMGEADSSWDDDTWDTHNDDESSAI